MHASVQFVAARSGATIAFSCEKRRLSAGEALFFPGEIGDTGYFVLSGAILLTEVGAEPEKRGTPEPARSLERARSMLP